LKNREGLWMLDKASVFLLLAACGAAPIDRPTGPESIGPISSAPEGEAPAGRKRYTSAEFRFTFDYPSELAPFELRGSAKAPPEPLFTVKVLTPEEAAPEIRAYAVGRFSVDVVANPRKLAVRDWLDAYGWPFGAAEGGRPAEVGGLPALDVTTGRELAPNRFLYVSRGDIVLRIAPIGAESQDILRSFRFLE
jgi:hypothetical protein